MNRKSFLKSCAALCVTPLLPAVAADPSLPGKPRIIQVGTFDPALGLYGMGGDRFLIVGTEGTVGAWRFDLRCGIGPLVRCYTDGKTEVFDYTLGELDQIANGSRREENTYPALSMAYDISLEIK